MKTGHPGKHVVEMRVASLTVAQGGAKVGLHLGVCETQFFLSLLLVNYYISFI